jgi:hypothetical protein
LIAAPALPAPFDCGSGFACAVATRMDRTLLLHQGKLVEGGELPH